MTTGLAEGWDIRAAADSSWVPWGEPDSSIQ
jgi:hypothetical protein